VERGAPLAFIESVLWDRGLRPSTASSRGFAPDRIRIEMEVASTRRAAGEILPSWPDGNSS